MSISQRGGPTINFERAVETYRELVVQGAQRSLWHFSMFSALNSEKRNTEVTKNRREIGLPLSVVYSFSSLKPQCSLWLFSVFSVLNSEKRNQ